MTQFAPAVLFDIDAVRVTRAIPELRIFAVTVGPPVTVAALVLLVLLNTVSIPLTGTKGPSKASCESTEAKFETILFHSEDEMDDHEEAVPTV